MKLSKRWLLDYVDLHASDYDYIHKMTMSGSKVEGVEKEGHGIRNVVVAEIISLEKHPDSDHLWVCSVNIGKEAPIQIVTGAQNLKVGDIVPAALDDSVVAGGKEIHAGKLRGVESCGMLCSLSELGLSVHDFPYAAADGIFVLGEDCERTLGTDILEAIGLNDTITEFEITPNRADCLSVLGLARETAATFDIPYKFETPAVKKTSGDVTSLLKVRIDAPERCYRYCGAVVENVRIKPSPRWLRERLRASGVRPINNIVDITNYVMLELGQPMHAFDLRYLSGNQVIVRTALQGEKITTLDGIERELTPDMLVIADEKAPAAVAGVMGGEFSGIMDDTATIVFESACFNGIGVRMTAKALGMRTESSARFEKELNSDGCELSLMRALQLVEMLDAGDIVSGIVDVYPTKKKQVSLPFEPEWVNNFIGINVPALEQKAILEKIGFCVKDGMIIAPDFRNDIEHQADISEEIARFYGYDKIPDKELSGVAIGYLSGEQQYERFLAQTMLALGYSEIQTYSFVSPKAYDKINLPSDSPRRESVKISNPLGEDTSIMRTMILPSMLEVLSRNYNARNENAKLFELAKEYISKGADVLPDENQILCLGLYGKDYDFFTIKGALEELLSLSGIDEYDVEAVSDLPYYHPGRCAKILKDGRQIVLFGQVHPSVQDNFEIGLPAYTAEIDFNTLFSFKKNDITYKRLPRFPALTRDLAFVCDRDIPVLKLEKLIKKAVGVNLEAVELFDVYQGEQIAGDKKSVAFSLRLRGSEGTLTTEEADEAMKCAIEALKTAGAVLRSV